jgi:hypothetical protein
MERVDEALGCFGSNAQSCEALGSREREREREHGRFFQNYNSSSYNFPHFGTAE